MKTKTRITASRSGRHIAPRGTRMKEAGLAGNGRTSEPDAEELKLREKLRAALSTAALLNYSPDELLDELKGTGMGTVERLAEALIALAKGGRCKRVEPTLMNLDAIWNSESPPATEQIVHRPPKMAFVASGVEYDPADIRRFDGRELCYMPSWRRGMPYLEVFEDKAFIKNWLRLNYLSRLARAMSDIAVKGQSPIPVLSERNRSWKILLRDRDRLAAVANSITT